MKKILKAIFGLDAGTQKRAVISIITYISDVIYVFGGIKVPDEKIDLIIKGALGVLTALVWIAGFYFNENYTPEGCEGTGYTRLAKENNELKQMLGDDLDVALSDDGDDLDD